MYTRLLWFDWLEDADLAITYFTDRGYACLVERIEKPEQETRWKVEVYFPDRTVCDED